MQDACKSFNSLCLEKIKPLKTLQGKLKKELDVFYLDFFKEGFELIQKTQHKMIASVEKGYRIKALSFLQNKKVTFLKTKEDGFTGSYGRLGLLPILLPTTFRVVFN